MAESLEKLSRPRFAVEASRAARLARFGTWTVLERTIANWVLTAVTAIGFGFAIVLVFDELSRFTGIDPSPRPLAPSHLGLALVAFGTAALVVAGWRYRAVLRDLRDADSADEIEQKTAAYAITIIAIFIGVFTFLAIAARAV